MEENTNTTPETGAAETTPQEAAPDKSAENTPAEKTFTQKELDEIVKQRLDRAKKDMPTKDELIPKRPRSRKPRTILPPQIPQRKPPNVRSRLSKLRSPVFQREYFPRRRRTLSLLRHGERTITRPLKKPLTRCWRSTPRFSASRLKKSPRAFGRATRRTARGRRPRTALLKRCGQIR